MFWFAVSPPVWVGLIANLNWIGNKEYFSWYWKWYVYFQAENLASLVLGYLMLPFLIIFQSYYTYLVFLLSLDKWTELFMENLVMVNFIMEIHPM